MRKLYKSLLTVALTVAGAFGGLGVQAQTAYYDVDSENITTVETGTQYVLQAAFYSTAYYISGTDFNTAIGDEALFEFEEAGTASDGSTTYYVKQVSTGKYIESPDVTADLSYIAYTDSKSRAFVCTVKESVYASDYSDEYFETADLSTYTYADPDNGYTVKEQSVVLCRSDWDIEKYNWLCGYSYPCWSPAYVNCNVWYIHKVTKSSAYDCLCTAYNELFGDGETPASYFVAGDGFGQVDASLLEAFQAAYDEATKLVSDTEQSDETYTACQKALEDTYQACKDGVKRITTGYYVIRNYDTSRGSGLASLFDTGSALNWDEFAFDGTSTIELDDAHYVWYVTKTEDGDNTYYLQNYYTKRYAGTQASNYSVVPTSEDASQVYLIDPASNAGAFNIYTSGVNNSYPALHADASTSRIVIWTNSSGASQWYFTPVSDDIISSLEAQVEQALLNTKAETLISDSKVALAKGISVATDATADGLYDNLGFVTEESRFWSNAKEETEGSYGALVDNDQTSFFHSTWSDGSTASLVHYIAVDLGEQVQYMQVKYSRRNTGSDGTPKTIHVYATNDTTGLGEGTCQWVDEGYLTFDYKYNSNDTYGSEVENFTGLTSIALDAPYQYVRFDVEHTMNDAMTNGNLYFHLSELHFYKGEYDASTSLIEAVPAEITAELKKQVAAAESELAVGDISRSTYDALTAAYDAFIAAFPDPDVVAALLEEAQAQLEAAEEGEDLGYFESGSKDELQAAIDAISPSIKDVMTVEQINTAKEALQEALATFTAKLNKPADGTILYIKSASSTEGVGGNYVYAQNSDEDQVMYGGYDSETASTDSYITERLNYYWRTIVNADGSYSFRNLATGLYLGNPKENEVDVDMSLTPDSVTLRSAKSAGLFNFVLADDIFYNAEPNSGGQIVTWGTASGADNSAFEFEVVESDNWMGSYHLDLDNATQVLTLPIEISGLCTNGHIYKVLGVMDNAVQLNAYEDDETIPAGTPVVYIPEEGSESGSNDFYPTATSLDAIETTSTALLSNGLQGTLQSAKPGAGSGIIFRGAITIATESDEVSANSGWFTGAMPTTTEAGETSLAIDGTITGIAQAVLAPATESVNVYTISGVKVRAAVKATDAVKNLPAGLYIVGGKKVLVK